MWVAARKIPGRSTRMLVAELCYLLKSKGVGIT
ncbi:hypothetical protein L915_19541 [Phytophthora nicotianae]|uniref:Uncharacterized protein n=1 Tax=Phytophthora nicotianae TaxID=4792 RepID=W2FSC0_PHYNI|nr:hypothetical protein L915_19541 [Phytophthora nicotianae]ETL26981.1 hypothetical protein L916_19430 [Phytophthora nicotianae]